MTIPPMVSISCSICACAIQIRKGSQSEKARNYMCYLCERQARQLGLDYGFMNLSEKELAHVGEALKRNKD